MTILRFTLERGRECEAVADGVQFADGTVVVRWRGEHPSTVTFSDWGHAMRVHHIGEPKSLQWTTARWHDGVCWACGCSIAARGAIFGGNGGQCLACSASWDGPPSRVHEPDAGSWRKVAELPAKGEGGRA